MAVVTEASLRARFSNSDLSGTTVFHVPEGTIVTPSAQAWLIDHRIDLVVGGRRRIKVAQTTAGSAKTGGRGNTVANPVAGTADTASPETKPEHLTSLRGTELVEKDHPLIALRGALDSLQSQIMLAQLAFRRLGLEKGVTDLGEVLGAVRKVLGAEVMEEPLPPLELLGWDSANLRRRSHHPVETFGLTHFIASVDDGEAILLLNALRTQARQVELAAYRALKLEDGSVSRPDIMEWLNRLSSVFYLMMFKVKTKEYGNG